jgi:hypothetical protein
VYRKLALIAALLAPGLAWGQSYPSPTVKWMNLQGAGSSGQYDAQISVTGGGSGTGQGTLKMNGALAFFLGPDASPNFAALSNPGAAEYWQASGNPTAFGALMLATNGTTSGNVNGYFAAQHQGTLTFGNGSGIILQTIDPGGPVGASLQILPANSAAGGPSEANQAASLISTGDLILTPLGASGRIGVSVPDGTSVGGLSRGQFSVDLQTSAARGSSGAVASGIASCLLGGEANTAGGGNSCVVGGFSNSVTGGYSFAGGGQNGSDEGRIAVQIHSGSIFSGGGDNQQTFSVFGNSATASASARLTTNHAAASATNCYNLIAGKTAAMQLILAGTDTTTPAHHVGWFAPALLYREAAGTMGIAVGTATTVGTDTVTVSLTVDSTNSCLNATVTAANADTWRWHLSVTASEVK